MAESTGAETTTPPVVETKLTDTPQAEEKPTEPVQDAEFWKGKASAMEKEAKKAAKRLAELEAKEKERADAELSETEKLKQKLAEAERKAAEIELSNMRQRVAIETGLPLVFADRLQGKDEDEMKADAAKIIEALPKADGKKPSAINPTNPAGGTTQETPEQKRARLLGIPQNVYDPSVAKGKGGGVYIAGSEE